MNLVGKRSALGLSLWSLPLFAFLAAAYLTISRAFPYYFLWDMDLVVGLDCLLLGGGLLPDHIHHTGFGLYLLTSWAHLAAYAWGLVSALDLGQLAQALNPLACLAELIDFLRRLSPWACLGIVLLLWSSLRVMFRPGLWLGLLSLLALGALPSLIYQGAMIRTELYSLLFWAGALMTLVLAARSAGPRRLAWLGAAGLLLGLTLMTKVQSAFYVAAAPLFYPLAGFLAGAEPGELWPVPGRRAARVALVLALFNLLAFAFILWRAYVIPIPEGAGAFMFRYEVAVTKRALLVLALLAGLAAYLAWGLRRGRTEGRSYAAAGGLTWLLLGFMVSLGLHFLVLGDPGQAWRYLLLNFKMTFLRQGFHLEVLGQRWDLFSYCWLTVLAHLAALGLLAWANSRRRNQALRRALYTALPISALAFLGVALSDRFILRDLVWVETLLSFLTLCYLLAAARYMGHRRAAPLISLGLTAALALAAVLGALKMPAQLDANVNQYGWSPTRYFHGVFGANHRRFDQLMRGRYAGRDLPAAWAFSELGAQAYRHAEIRRLWRFVLRNLGPDLKRVGAVLPGQPMWLGRPGWHIKSAPAELSRALLLDVHGLTPGQDGFLQKELIWRHSEYLDKAAPPPEEPALALLPRGDLQVYVFVPVERLEALRRAGLSPGQENPRIQAAKGDQSISLVGLEVQRYCVLPLTALGQSYFLVIRPRYPL
ncbi:MAG: hypothetical protein AB1814_14425 [Thermodesulfobacteriota bacterium]